MQEQLRAATHHAGVTLGRMAAYDSEVRLQVGRWPFLTERLQEAVAAFNSRTAKICPHLRAPAVMHCTAGEPTRLRCVPCTALMHPSPVDEGTCDRCGSFDPEGVYAGIVQHGPLLMTYGLCDSCLSHVYGQGSA